MKLLTILSINLLLIPNICFGFDSNCFFKAAEDIPAEFIYLSKNCQAKIIAYVDKDGPVKEPIKGDCNREPFECRVGDTLSKCMPCAASSAYLDKFLDFKDKYTELCQANKENILETACNEIFSVSTKKSTPTKQAYSPESISAPVFNSTNSKYDFSNTPSMMSTDQEIQRQYKEQIEEPTNQTIDLCKKSGGDWNGKKCKCDENKGLTRNKDTGICECSNTTYKYNTKSKKCTKTAQDIAIENEFDRQNRINRLRDACKNSGGSYDQISKDIADSYICNCQADQKYNTQSGLCECTESGYIYSATEKKCIKPKITIDEYKQIEKGITEINDKTIASINTQCSNTQPAPTVCNSKEELIQQIKDLQTQLLNDLKEMGANQ